MLLVNGTEDGKGEDPLKGDDLDGQLFEAKLTKGQQAEGVSEVLVVAKNDVSLSDDKVHPDEDVGHQPQGRAVTANGHGTVPEEGDQRPGIGSSHDGQVDERVQV
ncbi:hypothetical protein McanCB49686_004297 [Microsporum canis]